jgi:hypothetical protein
MQIALRLCIKDLKQRWIFILVLELCVLWRAALDILLPRYLQLMPLNDYLPGILVMLAFSILIVLTIQADPLVGDRQFWVTRPISRWNLLAGKALFIIGTIHLPILIAQLTAMLANHLSLSQHWFLLLQNQLAIGAFAAIVVLMAAATRSLARFALLAIVLFYAFQLTDFFFLILPAMLGAVNVEPWDSAAGIQSLIRFPIIILTALILLWFQYSTRARNRTLIFSILAITFSINDLIMSSTIFWHPMAQHRARMTGVLRNTSPVSVQILPDKFRFYKLESDQLHPFRLDMPISIQGIPESYKLVFEKIKCAVFIPGRAKWESGWIGKDIVFSPKLTQDQSIPSDGDYLVSLKPFEWYPLGHNQNTTVHLQATLAFRLIAPPQTILLPQNRLVPVFDQDMRCGTYVKNGVMQPVCMAAGIQKAWLNYKPSALEFGASYSIWRQTISDQSILGLSSPPSGASISMQPEEAWFTTSIDVPKIRMSD